LNFQNRLKRFVLPSLRAVSPFPGVPTPNARVVIARTEIVTKVFYS